MKTLEQRVADLERTVASLAGKASSSAAPVDLDTDKYADFTIRKSPPKWIESGGRDYAGENISTTTPEFCDAIAGFLDWQAEGDEKKNYSYTNDKGKVVFPAQYARKDAARARAWAVRLRASAPQPRAWQPPKGAPQVPQDDFNYGANDASDDGIPF